MKLIRKKLLVLTVLAMTALIFYGCSDSPKTVSVEGISPIVVVTGPTLVNDDLYIWETNTDGKLTSAVLNAVVQPPTATNKSVNWVLKAGSEYVNFDPATRTVSAIAVSGESYATIKATTVDGDFPATLRVFVLAAGDEPGPGGTDTDATVPFTWKFSTTIPGWQDYAGASNPVMKTDAVLANNMTITASKLDVATAANGIRWQPARTAAGMTGCIQPDGSNALARGERFVKIEDVPGPFSITLNYTSTNATNNGRFAQLYIDGTKVADGAPTPASNADTTLRQLKYDHT
ncbi:MAG: hypothetical protein LBC80_03390, partial [Treponema sp.]|nr:hypothetical protein [Treponema sp.]